jgi:hypothetical protein
VNATATTTSRLVKSISTEVVCDRRRDGDVTRAL